MDAVALIEVILVFVAVLAFGFWELYSLRRDKKRAAAREAEKAARPQRDDTAKV